MASSTSSSNHISSDWPRAGSAGANSSSSSLFSDSFGLSNQNDDDFTIINPDITNINNDDDVIQLKNPVVPTTDFPTLPPSSSSASSSCSSSSDSLDSSNHKSPISISTKFPKHVSPHGATSTSSSSSSSSSTSSSFGFPSSFAQASPVMSPRTNSIYDPENTTGFFNISTTSPATSFSITTPDVSPHTMSEYDLFQSGPLVFPDTRNSIDSNSNIHNINYPNSNILSNSSPPLTPLSLNQKSSAPSNHSPHGSVSSITSLLSLPSQHDLAQDPSNLHHISLQQQGFAPITHFAPILPSSLVIQDLSTEGAIVYLLSPQGIINCVSSNSEALLGRSHESQKNTSLAGYLYPDNQNNVMYVFLFFFFTSFYTNCKFLATFTNY